MGFREYNMKYYLFSIIVALTLSFETTDSHPFWVLTNDPEFSRGARDYADENGVVWYHENLEATEYGFWVEAKDLREGDVFLGANGELSTLIAVERVEFGVD